MTNREQAQTGMFIAVEKELEDDKTHYATNNAFKAEVVLFLAAWAANKAAAEKAHVDNSGFSQEKLNQKMVLANITSNYSGKAYVRFMNLDKPSLAEQLNTEPSDYYQKADAECANLAQTAHDFFAANIDLLDPDTLKPEDLQSLQVEITKFIELKGSSEIVHEVSTELTQLYKDSFGPVMMRIDHLKFLVRDYETTDIDFYTRFMASTKIPTVNIHHTYVEVHVVWKNSGQPVEGVLFKLSNSKKTAVSDGEGNAKLEEVKAGKAELSGELASKVKYKANIVIKRGTTNHYEVVIEEEPI